MIKTQPATKSNFFLSRATVIHALTLAMMAFLLWRGAASLDYQWRWARIPRYFFRRVDGEWTMGLCTNALFE